jgi:hypothetical protein
MERSLRACYSGKRKEAACAIHSPFARTSQQKASWMFRDSHGPSGNPASKLVDYCLTINIGGFQSLHSQPYCITPLIA